MPRAVVFALAGLLAAWAPGAIAHTFQVSWPGAVFLDESDGHVRVRITDNGTTLKFEARGKFDLEPDESDVARLESAGTFELEERRHGRTQRRYEARGLADGRIQREFEADGGRREMNAADREWLQQSLQKLLANTTFAVETHVRQLLAQGGRAKALQAIGSMPADHVQAKHYRELLKQDGQHSETCVQVAEQASRTLDSDHELGDVLTATVERASGDREVALACVRGTQKIGSDHERRDVLVAIVQATAPDPEVASAVAASAGEMGSDHERAEVLLEIVAQGALGSASAASFFDAARGMGSDHECAEVLDAVVEKSKLPPEILLAVIESTEHLGSDSNKGRVLLDLAASQPVEGRVREAYLEAARQMGSEHRRDEVLEAVGEEPHRRH